MLSPSSSAKQSPYTPLAFCHSGNSAESPLCDKMKYYLNFQLRAESQMQIASREPHTLWRNRGLLTFPSSSCEDAFPGYVSSSSQHSCQHFSVCLPMMQDSFEDISMLGSWRGMISLFIKSKQLTLGNIEFLHKMDDAIELPFINELFFVGCCCHCAWILRLKNC